MDALAPLHAVARRARWRRRGGSSQIASGYIKKEDHSAYSYLKLHLGFDETYVKLDMGPFRGARISCTAFRRSYHLYHHLWRHDVKTGPEVENLPFCRTGARSIESS
eukprot:232171-Pleurochrysis_carterae.AAC.1